MNIKSGKQTYVVPPERPGCVKAVAIGMGVLAMPPLVAAVIAVNDADFYTTTEDVFTNYLTPLGLYWGDVILSLVLAWGLWQLKNWARVITIAILSLAIIAAFVVSGLGAGVALLALLGYVVYWLASNGEYFAQPKETTAERESLTIKSVKKTPIVERPSGCAIAAYVIGGIGVLMILLGLLAVVVETSSFGLYFGILPGFILALVAWAIRDF